MSQALFFKKKIYFYKKNLQKNHTYNIIPTIYKKEQKIKTKKKLEILKERKERSRGTTMSFIESRYIICSSSCAYMLFYVID